MSLTVGSLFAGIGGFDLGFTRAGFDVRWQVESEPFCQKVLVKRFSHAVVYDDVCTVGAHNLERVDVICGGFPCQDLSVAGQRTGLGGDRSGLFWQMTRIAAELAPAWMVIENVPGLLTSAEGRDFHTVLSALADGWFRRSYRILDSRYFGVAQRRRRVFLVLRAGNARGRTRSVLFESTSGTGRAQTRKEARASVAATLRGRSAQRGVNEPGRGGEDDSNLVAIGVHANQRGELRTSTVAGSLTSSKSGKQFEGIAFALGSHAGTSDGEATNQSHACGGPVGMGISEECAHSLRAGRTQSVAFALRADPGGIGQGHNTNFIVEDELANTLQSLGKGRGSQTEGHGAYVVRRLTPLECERVQGFPDGWTCLCGDGHRGTRYCSCPDTPRYKALGNAVTVTVIHWIAQRLKAEMDRVRGAA